MAKLKLTKLDVGELLNILSYIYYGNNVDYIDLIGIQDPKGECDTVMFVTRDEYISKDTDEESEDIVQIENDASEVRESSAEIKSMSQEDFEKLI
jgi:hypothetical protein